MLGRLSADVREQLLAEAFERVLPAHSFPYNASDPPSLAVIVSGLLRTYIVSGDGREITIRYGRPGDVLGMSGVVVGPVRRNVQVLVEARVLFLNPKTLRSLAHKDVSVAWLMVEELAALLEDLWEEVGGAVFGTVPQRVASHILDLATAEPGRDGLVAVVTQQELANAVGSVREVVQRSIRQFREEGLLEVTPLGIRIKEPEKLSERARSRKPRDAPGPRSTT
ncbi:MAG: family transcriptional regulator, cyclic receptor protein [Chloroflexota bacterium]|nr:family transcriptional regulator, cyclic receptor protein [Chloroflexota bacterium]